MAWVRLWPRTYPSFPRPALPVSCAGSDSRVIIIPTLDSEALGDRCRELCDLFVDLLNGDPVPLLMQHLLHLGNGGDSL